MKFTFFQFIKSFFSKKSQKPQQQDPQPVELTWETQDGRVFMISEMDTAHLKNTVNWMERVASGNLFNEISLPKHPKYQAMKTELEKRTQKTSHG